MSYTELSLKVLLNHTNAGPVGYAPQTDVKHAPAQLFSLIINYIYTFPVSFDKHMSLDPCVLIHVISLAILVL